MFGERFRRKMRDSIQFSKRLKGEPIVDLGLLDAVNNGEISLDRINESLTYSPCLNAGDSWIQTILAY